MSGASLCFDAQVLLEDQEKVCLVHRYERMHPTNRRNPAKHGGSMSG